MISIFNAKEMVSNTNTNTHSNRIVAERSKYLYFIKR